MQSVSWPASLTIYTIKRLNEWYVTACFTVTYSLIRIIYLWFKKGKVVPVHSMKVYTGSIGTAPLILNLGTKWRCVVNIKFRRVIPGKEPRYPLKRGLGGPQSWSGRFEEEENLSPLPELEPQIVQPLSYT
jgi:hypothetical protein